MKRKLFVVLSLVVMVSMLFSACSSTAPTALPEQTEPTATTAAVENEPVEAEPVEAEPTTEVEGGAAVEPTAAPEPVVATDRKGAWLDKVIFTAIEEVDAAVAQIEAGAVDMYVVSSDDAAVYEQVQGNPDLKYASFYGSSNQMLFNVAECTDTTIFNPFTNMKIREAMNWALDRNYISQEILGGLGAPKFTALSSVFPDYSLYADLMSAIEIKYAYDFDKAKEVVTAEMEGMGATLNADGKWEKDGKLVTLIGLIRVEDKRKEIGNYFANQLEELGFTVDRQEKTSPEAAPIWIGTDPAECAFHFYTAGWISPQIYRDEGGQFVQFNTDRQQKIPLFSEYKPSEEFLTAADKLFTNNFSTMEERRELFEIALPKSMEESWWGVWVNENVSFSPYTNSVVSAYDLAGGIGSAQLWPYTVRVDGQEGGELRVAQNGIFVDPWNPIAGSNWTQDSSIQRLSMDWGTIYDPYTGLLLPKLVERAEVVAEEGLPIRKTLDWVDLAFEDPGSITVPEDAWVDWDAANQKFITAAEKYPEGVSAKTKSTVYYIPEMWDTTWHDGSKFTVADFVFTMIMTFDGGKPESKNFDALLQSGVETYLSHFKGIRIVSTDPLVIETYDDQFSLDAENTITDWFPSRYVPASSTNGMFSWHGLTPAIMAEENRELAFSPDKVEELGGEAEWTNLLSGPALDIQAKYLDQALAEQYIPFAPTMGEFVTAEEAVERYENLKKFYSDYGHLFIGTGPYFIEQVFPVEGSITATRYEDYIFPADQWISFSEPMLATAEIEGPISVTSGEEAAFDVYVNFGDEAYPSDQIEKVAYILFNEKNEVVEQGEAEMVADGTYQVVLSSDQTSQLEAGASKISVAVTSRVVSIPALAAYEFVVAE